MHPTADAHGQGEIRTALSESRRLFAACGVFSAFVNLLMLTGPLFMLQVYDRVLTSRSAPTLVALIAIMAFLFLTMGVLDHARGRVLARVGVRLNAALSDRVLKVTLARAVSPAERARPATGLRDLEALQRFTASPAPFAFFDAPWTPVFLFALFMFHWTLGVLAVLGGALLVAVALANQARTRRLQQEAAEAAAEAEHFVEQLRAGGETVHGLGMQGAVGQRAGEAGERVVERSLGASDRGGFYGVTTKTLRLFLQSLMLGLGAWLAIGGQITAGVMIAASILLGRALAPIDQAVMQWPTLQRVVAAFRALAALLEETPPQPRRTRLPTPRAVLAVQGLMVAAPGARYAAVRGASLKLLPGQAAGIAGRSASGKSTFARALAGVWKPLGGSIRLDGAELEQYGADLGRHVGYLPQEVVLFDGTVAENIARMDPAATDEDVVEAAKRTGGHEMILALPGGYDFQVAAGGAALSGGQRQRIALARAFYGSPALVVMDEPDSNLDADGTMALARAVDAHKRRGGAAVIVAHRHGAFAQCDVVYLMQGGKPVPATAEPGKPAPVRSLQKVRHRRGQRRGEAPQAAAARADGARPDEAADPGPLPAASTNPGREAQIAEAIARVRGLDARGQARPRAVDRDA